MKIINLLRQIDAAAALPEKEPFALVYRGGDIRNTMLHLINFLPDNCRALALNLRNIPPRDVPALSRAARRKGIVMLWRYY